MDKLLLTQKGKNELRHLMGDNASKGLSIGYSRYGVDSRWNQESKAGSTASMVLITNSDIYCANCGDSRTIISEYGIAQDLSIDHKPNHPIEYQRILN